jgi:hypothetical protein
VRRIRETDTKLIQSFDGTALRLGWPALSGETWSEREHEDGAKPAAGLTK